MAAWNGHPGQRGIGFRPGQTDGKHPPTILFFVPAGLLILATVFEIFPFWVILVHRPLEIDLLEMITNLGIEDHY